MRDRSRLLRWSKEVERRVRDLYKRLYPDAKRAKFDGREDRLGHPDIVGIPFHVQVKARSSSTVGRYWREADEANFTNGPTHLVIQDLGRPPLLVIKLADWIEGTDGRLVGNREGEDTTCRGKAKCVGCEAPGVCSEAA